MQHATQYPHIAPQEAQNVSTVRDHSDLYTLCPTTYI